MDGDGYTVSGDGSVTEFRSTDGTTQTVAEMIARWESGEGRPYKGSLIDLAAYERNPSDIGCMCAQGQVLHLVGGWSPERLVNTDQHEADVGTAKLLGISRAHAVLLRCINDTVDGAPAIVLTHPETVLGDQAQTVLALWRHLDRMSAKQWAAARAAAKAAAWDAARFAAWDAAGVAAGAAAWDAAGVAAGAAVWDAAGATAEIMGARVLREQGKPFFFLPAFGFADPESVLAADREYAA